MFHIYRIFWFAFLAPFSTLLPAVCIETNPQGMDNYVLALPGFALLQQQLWMGRRLRQGIHFPALPCTPWWHGLVVAVSKSKDDFEKSNQQRLLCIVPKCCLSTSQRQIFLVFNSSPLSMGDMFSDFQWVLETMDRIESCTYYVFSYIIYMCIYSKV